MPTLSELQGQEEKRRMTLETVDLGFVRKQLMFSKRNIADGKWWTRFTYGLVHFNTDHLVNNLTMLVPSALSVQRGFGTVAMWIIFLGGCAAGTTDMGNLRTQQDHNAAKQVFLPGFLREAWSGAANSATHDADASPSVWERVADQGASLGAHLLAPVMSSLTDYVGCSAGCCALLGADFCLSVEALVGLFWRLEQRDHTKHRGEDDVILQFSTHAVSCYFTLSLLHDEWQIMSTRGSQDGTDHAGHLLGLGFGIAAYGVFRTLKGISRLLRRPPPPPQTWKRSPKVSSALPNCTKAYILYDVSQSRTIPSKVNVKFCSRRTATPSILLVHSEYVCSLSASDPSDTASAMLTTSPHRKSNTRERLRCTIPKYPSSAVITPTSPCQMGGTPIPKMMIELDTTRCIPLHIWITLSGPQDGIFHFLAAFAQQR
ncbi:Hypothetical protein (Fragment), partial [Durusdinium trenchii]